MIRREELILVGHYNKPHGVAGEISATIDVDCDVLQELSCLVSDMDGIYVPFFVNDCRVKNADTVLLSIDGIHAAFVLFLTRREDEWEQAAREAYGVYRQKGLAPEGLLAKVEEDLFVRDIPPLARTLKDSVFEELQFECAAGAFTVRASALVGKGEDRETVFIPKGVKPDKITNMRNLVKAWVLGAVYILSGKADLSKDVYISGTDDERKLWDNSAGKPPEDMQKELEAWLTGVCGDMAREGFYCAPAPVLYDKFYKNDGEAAEYESEQALKAVYLEDMQANTPAHYWHLLLTDFPERLKAPTKKEYEDAMERLKPVFEAAKKKIK